jgi:cytochrome c5
VSVSQDRKFFDNFMLVIGILVAIAVGLYGLARMVSARTQEANVLQDAAMVTATNDRIAPVAKLAVAGKDNSALEPVAETKADAGPAKDMTGEEVFGMACIACHGAGIGGAPKFKDKAAWAPHISKGIDTLHDHALKGFQDEHGFMPAKGGRPDLSDKSVLNAVDYMVGNSK